MNGVQHEAWTTHGRYGRYLLLLLVLLAAGCNRRVLSIVLDMPESRAVPESSRLTRLPAGDSLTPPAGGPREAADPPLEAIGNRDSLLALLPRDRAGDIDWSRAVRDGLICPRASLPGAPVRAAISADQVAFDIVIPGKDSLFNVSFPHGAHVEWAACASCHPRPSRTDSTGVKATLAVQATECGGCHSGVAFAVDRACDRCHTRLRGIAASTKPAAASTVMRMARAGIDMSAPLPPGQRPLGRFDHTPHRLRYQCTACHNALFPMRAGATVTTMAEMGEGRSCGRCHNGKAGFDVGYTNCDRCHVAE